MHQQLQQLDVDVQACIVLRLEQQPHRVLVTLHVAQPGEQLTIAQVSRPFPPMPREGEGEFRGGVAGLACHAVGFAIARCPVRITGRCERRVARLPAHDLLVPPALLRVAREETLQELAQPRIGDIADVLAARGQMVQDDRFRQSGEWMAAARGLEEHDAQRPVVRLGIDHPGQTLRGCVGKRARGAGEALGGVQHRGDAEIDEHELERVQAAQEDILGLQVTMDKLDCVDRGQGAVELPDELRQHGALEGAATQQVA